MSDMITGRVNNDDVMLKTQIADLESDAKLTEKTESTTVIIKIEDIKNMEMVIPSRCKLVK